MPFYIPNPCDHDYAVCLTYTTEGTINGEAIKIEDDVGTVTAITVYLKRSTEYTLPDNNATITLRVYKSGDATPTSSKYLWDSTILNPAQTGTIQAFTFTFDYDLEVYDVNDQKLVNWLWFELEENIDDNVTSFLQYNPVYYAYYNGQNNKYSFSDMWEYSTSWSLSESHYTNSPSWYNDIAFALYGTHRYPTTPLPTPTETAINPDNPPCYDCNGTIPSPDENSTTGWDPTFNDTTILCPECIGNETVNPFDTISEDSYSESFLKGVGYCNTLGCTLDDIIAFLYDLSLIGCYFSFAIVLGKMWHVRKR